MLNIMVVMYNDSKRIGILKKRRGQKKGTNSERNK
jgi:hypothetical protein